MSEVNELKAIRARHEACGHTIEWPNFDSFEAHNDRATLLRLLDAAREELREVKEAALSAWGLLDNPSCPVTGLDETRRARAILAEALKEKP